MFGRLTSINVVFATNDHLHQQLTSPRHILKQILFLRRCNLACKLAFSVNASKIWVGRMATQAAFKRSLPTSKPMVSTRANSWLSHRSVADHVVFLAVKKTRLCQGLVSFVGFLFKEQELKVMLQRVDTTSLFHSTVYEKKLST